MVPFPPDSSNRRLTPQIVTKGKFSAPPLSPGFIQKSTNVWFRELRISSSAVPFVGISKDCPPALNTAVEITGEFEEEISQYSETAVESSKVSVNDAMEGRYRSSDKKNANFIFI